MPSLAPIIYHIAAKILGRRRAYAQAHGPLTLFEVAIIRVHGARSLSPHQLPRAAPQPPQLLLRRASSASQPTSKVSPSTAILGGESASTRGAYPSVSLRYTTHPRAISSGVEHLPYKQGVAGSIQHRPPSIQLKLLATLATTRRLGAGRRSSSGTMLFQEHTGLCVTRPTRFADRMR